MATLEQLGSEKYVLLTTFRKDGRAVATPVWVVRAGDQVTRVGEVTNGMDVVDRLHVGDRIVRIRVTIDP